MLKSVPGCGGCAMPIYMQYGSISGNSEDAPGANWVELSSFSFDIEQSLGSSSGRGTAPGKVQFPFGNSSSGTGAGKQKLGEINITKVVDNASSQLFQACCSGKEVAVSIVLIPKGPGPRHRLTMGGAVISDIQPHYPPSGGGAMVRHEKVTLTFSEYHFNGMRNAAIPLTLRNLSSV